MNNAFFLHKHYGIHNLLEYEFGFLLVEFLILTLFELGKERLPRTILHYDECSRLILDCLLEARDIWMVAQSLHHFKLSPDVRYLALRFKE